MKDLMPPMKVDHELIELLARCKKHTMTPREIWDQRVSWAFGQSKDRKTTRRKVEQHATIIYGKRPDG